jgi:hypothetical protein
MFQSRRINMIFARLDLARLRAVLMANHVDCAYFYAD